MLDKLYGIHSEALQLKARRMEVLSTNIANADTPGFKAKDIDFRALARFDAVVFMRTSCAARALPAMPNTLSIDIAYSPFNARL